MPLIIGISMLLICIIMGIFNWNKKNHSIYLIFFYAITGLLLLAHYFIFFKPNITGIYILYLHFAPLYYCSGLFLYFYVKSTLDNKDILQNKYNYLHFIPAFLQFLAISKYYLMDKAEKMKYVQLLFENPQRFFRMQIDGVYFNQIESLILRPVSILIYCIICIILLIKKYPFFKKSFVLHDTRSKKYQILYTWILIIINTILALNLIYAFYQVYFLPITLDNPAFFYTRGFLFTNLFGQIGSLFLFPSILYGFIPREKKIAKTKNPFDVNEENISEDLKIKGRKIWEYIHHEKPFLDPNFSKSDISIRLKISPKDVNDVFDFIIKEKFSSLKNKLRVEQAKEILMKGGANKITMDGIGLNAGFASRSSFYAIFKAETGYTPVEYIDKLAKSENK